MKTNSRFIKILTMALLFMACDAPKKEKVDYEIASPVYIALAEKSLDYLASFDLDSFAEMLSDSVEYELPDGKKLIGKTALINYWKDYQNALGIKSMTISNANYLPIDNHTKSKGNEFLGVKVVVDFTNRMAFNNKNIFVKMNFSFHFNKEKMIDKINTNYDQTLISKANNPEFEVLTQKLSFGTID